MIKVIKFGLIAVGFALAPICFAEEPSTTIRRATVKLVFLYNSREYSSVLFNKSRDDKSIPIELRTYAKPGDSIGYKRYQGMNIEEVSGHITEDRKVILSNGMKFSAENMTIFEILQKLKSIDIMLRSPNFGYIE